MPYFQCTFYSKPYISAFYYSTGHVQPRSMRKRWVRQFEFLTEFSPKWFFHSWYTPKEHVFRDPNTFSNLHKAFSSISQFVLIQCWTALIQRKPALNSSETALISAEIHEISETALFSADLLWDFNPGKQTVEEIISKCVEKLLSELHSIFLS